MIRLITVLLAISLFGCSKNKASKELEQPSEKQANLSDNKPVEEQEVVEEIREEKQQASWENVQTQKLTVNGYFPQFTLDGNAIIYTSKTYQGLWMYDLETKSTKQLCDKKGAGYQPIVLQDKIIYQVKARLKFLEEVSLSTLEITKVAKQYARLIPSDYANELQENTITARISGDLFSIEIKDENGKVKSISPQGKKNYISQSLSPNQQLLVYKVAGLGAYISDLEGSIIKELGDVNTPDWLGNGQVVYAKSADDGMQTLSSEVFVYDIKADKEYLISSNIAVQMENPKGNKAGNKLVMNAPNGDIYLSKIQ